MNFFLVPRVSCVVFFLCCLLITTGYSQAIEWQQLEKGLYLTQLSEKQGKDRQEGDEPDIFVLKIDPDYFRFRLLSASEYQGQRRSLQDWVEDFGLVAGINASMFWEDFETSTGYMKNFDHINNDLIHPDYNAFFCFHPRDPDLPQLRLIDRINVLDWQEQIENYHTVIQSYRMISSQQENVWQKNNQSHSVAAIGIEKETDDVFFIFSQKPRTIPRLNSILLSSPLSILTCMFVEGGPTAGLYIKAQSLQQGWYGLTTNSLWKEKPETFNKIPNIIGIKRK